MKFWTGLLFGLGLGVLIGLLVAPQSGEATRAQLSERGIQLRDGSLGEQVRARAQEAVTQGRELYGRTKQDLNERYQRAKSGEL
jgi:gas vesicle protein